MNGKPESILEKAIEKAVDSGYRPMFWVSLKEQKEAKSWEATSRTIYWTVPGRYPGFAQNVKDLLFDHNFAKALWGECDDWRDQVIPMNGCERHLQQMVLAKDPIVYLGEHIPGDE